MAYLHSSSNTSIDDIDTSAQSSVDPGD